MSALGMLNFRINVFGFPSAPVPSGSPANFGFLDQRLAVEWLRDNIAAFGGSPRNIIIVG